MARRRLFWLILLALMLLLFVHYCVRIVPPRPQTPTVSKPAAASRAERDLVIPVAGIKPEQIVDSYGQARQAGERRHDAIDIMAPRGTPVRAAAAGRIQKLFVSADGGNTVYIRRRDRRWMDYYAHLDRYRRGLREGQWVEAGELIGTVGATGNADPLAPHLHFAVHRMQPGEKWHEGTPVNPYPSLAGGGTAR